MRSDPDPEKAVRHIDGDRAVAGPAYPDRVDVAHFLKPESSSARVLFPDSISPAHCPPDWLRQPRYNCQNSLVPDDFIHRSGFTGSVLGARPGDHAIESAGIDVLFEFLVPQPVETFVKFLRQLPCLSRWKFLDGFSYLGYRAHK